MSKYAVFMDYELDGKRNTVVLGGSIQSSSYDAMCWLESMRFGHEWGYCADDGQYMWEVDEDQLPWGYKFQTYYVAAYTDDQLMIGVS